MGVSAATTWLSLMTIGACAQARGAATASAVAARAVRRVVVAGHGASLLGCSTTVGLGSIFGAVIARPHAGYPQSEKGRRGCACRRRRASMTAAARTLAPRPSALSPMDPSDPYAAWLGRTEERRDTVTATPVAALAATLDRDDPAPGAGTTLPPLWHWLYFLPLAQAERDRPRRPPAPRRLPAAGGIAAPHVGGRAALVPAAAAGRRRDDADVADREHRQQAGALRAARLRHRRARDRDGGRRRRCARSTTSSTATCRRRARPRSRPPRRPTRPSRARSPPTTCCSSAIRRSPSTATASTTTGATSPRSRAIRA